MLEVSGKLGNSAVDMDLGGLGVHPPYTWKVYKCYICNYNDKPPHIKFLYRAPKRQFLKVIISEYLPMQYPLKLRPRLSIYIDVYL